MESCLSCVSANCPHNKPPDGRADACTDSIEQHWPHAVHSGTVGSVRKRIRLPKRLLTLAELAIYLDVSCVTLYELIEHEDNGNFPAIRIGDEWYVALDDVPEWLLRLSDKRGT